MAGVVIQTSDIKLITVDTFFIPSGSGNIAYLMVNNHNNGFADVVYLNYSTMKARLEINKDFTKSKKTKMELVNGEYKDVEYYDKPEFSIKSKKWIFDKLFRRLDWGTK